MERKFDLIEDVEDLGSVSEETLGSLGNQIEVGAMARTTGLERE
ncbi:hypothetical protein [Novosphingobium percolationis]|nr:hypothetical protein [Novosphingobium percolationis]